MQITVRGLHLEITQSIKDYAKKKAEKIGDGHADTSALIGYLL